MSYSGNGGGTLTLPSPTHVHHVDVSSAVRSLRRSLSRSPSKFRLVTPRSPSSSPQSPLSPTHAHAPPLSRALSQPNVSSSFPSGAQAYTPSPLAKQFPTSVKLSLRSASRAKAIPSRGTSRTRTSPKSPLKRALSASSDSGNSQITTTSEELEGLENRRGGSLSPTTRKSLDRQKAMPEVAAPINLALSRVSEVDIDASATISSPLKRNDAIMNLDQASLGSPVAKRRSLHGSGGFGHDFNVFDHGPSSSPRFDIHEDSHKEYQLSAAGIIGAALEAEHLPRRSSSLRKSTLQQRQEQKRSWGRRSALNALNSMSSANSSQEPSPSPEEASTPVAPRTSRPRLSLDQFVPPTAARESPFVQGALPNASVHMLHPNQHTTHQPHPLSRTMTTSSSTSSLADDSPTHLPVHFAEHPRPKLDFSKSLPAGSLRPFALEAAAREHASNSFATPESYRAVKPLPAAFMSTGLISKVNRNPEEVSAIRVKGMPDTPCKKPVAGFSVVAGPVPGSAIAKARHIRHSFGAPSTPFNPHGATFMQGTFGKGATFGHAFGNRRSSFLSNDGEDCIESPENQSDSQSSADYDMPPTPTKQSLTSDSCGIRSPYGLRSMPLPVSAIGQGRPQVHPRKSSKLNIFINRDDQEEDEDEEDDTDLSEPDLSSSPTTAHFRGAMGSSVTFPSFARNRARRGSNLASPAPLLTRSLKASFSGHGQSPPFSPSRRPGFAKISHVAPASPLERIDFFERPARSPRTPATEDSVVPPDPSGLSIRAERDDGQEGKMQGVQSSGAGVSMLPPPATPTTGRESFLSFGLGHSKSITPITDFSAAQVDEALTSRFEKIELVGTGEFSQVYRVTQPAPSIALGHRHHQFHFGGPGSPMTASRSSLPDRVFAVKKSRQPYQGHRDRARKLQEVNVLRALGHSDHVVHLLDSWESKDHLYIQTEFCEEGSLDLFLTQVGRKGRLDDFRIWKILLELGQGLRHIHDSGFIHLDLKPANIFITFEGVLKIGDFGMATSFPAQPGIEGEGDREYIGPEILLGKYDKPADIFALGLIMLEIAGNVQLPDNGPTWQRLRSGDMSDVPSLTWSSGSASARDENGVPIEEGSGMSLDDDEAASDDEVDTERQWSPSLGQRNRSSRSTASNLFGSVRRGELHRAPDFMRDAHHEHALDAIVRRMISPAPEDRPTVHEILAEEGIRWVEARRRAGATIFEGNWGPADDVLADDAEMMDV